MPTYEYQCTRCGHQFEVIHRVGETVERCERCSAPVRRIFSPPGLIFKGPGFHINDYRKTPAPTEGDGKAPAAGKDAPKPSASGESGGSAAPSSSGAGSKSS